MTLPELGVIEGYYGAPWSWTTRRAVVELLARHGYTFYHYAPKGDPHVRERWHMPWPGPAFDALASFAEHCHGCGLRFGVGLTPVGLQNGRNDRRLDQLLERVRQINRIGVDDLVLLFDDLAGDDRDNLASRQADITHRVAAAADGARIFVCPTYYADDPLLDNLFGPRSPDYLRSLGEHLDPSVRVFWAGEEICPAEITPGTLASVTEQLGRRPVLWDNYPVNDGRTAREHLHLRGFTGRPHTLADAVAGHAINPALQGWLSCIPALTLPVSYRDGMAYRYAHAHRRAAETVLGPELGACLMHDLPLLADRGRARLTAEERSELTARYEAFDHPGAREVITWLNAAEAQTQAPTGA